MAKLYWLYLIIQKPFSKFYIEIFQVIRSFFYQSRSFCTSFRLFKWKKRAEEAEPSGSTMVKDRERDFCLKPHFRLMTLWFTCKPAPPPPKKKKKDQKKKQITIGQNLLTSTLLLHTGVNGATVISYTPFCFKANKNIQQNHFLEIKHWKTPIKQKNILQQKPTNSKHHPWKIRCHQPPLNIMKPIGNPWDSPHQGWRSHRRKTTRQTRRLWLGPTFQLGIVDAIGFTGA